ncbi:MAG: sialate O-acetylesterase [Clostridia bacterium]|nr:sialate O-acetylesterase [Clostridia bacterium]
MTHSILIIGQSNMAGRGFIADAEPLDTCGEKLYALRNGRWQVMFRPVNPDRAFSGTCLAESFAKAYYLDHPDVTVGVIPCADGGTSLSQWEEGGLLFDNAVTCTRLAMRISRLVAILWHQGEGDCNEACCAAYFDKITAIMKALRRELGAEDVPLVVGGLGDYLVKYPAPDLGEWYSRINAELIRYAESHDRVGFASAEGLTPNPDNLHFNHASLMEFGLRYYAEFRKLERVEKNTVEALVEEDTKRSAMEML